MRTNTPARGPAATSPVKAGIEQRIVTWLRQRPLWQLGAIVMATGLFVFASELVQPARDREYLVMMPMVSLENFGLFAMALGALVTFVGLAKGRIYRLGSRQNG